MIRVLVSGSLQAEPVQRTSQNGNSYTTAKLRADGKDGTSTWCNLIAFGEEGGRLATLKVGAALSLSGRADLQAWLDKTGEAKAGLSIVVDELVTLKPKPRSVGEHPRPRSRSRASEPAPTGPAFDDLDSWQP